MSEAVPHAWSSGKVGECGWGSTKSYDEGEAALSLSSFLSVRTEGKRETHTPKEKEGERETQG